MSIGRVLSVFFFMIAVAVGVVLSLGVVASRCGLRSSFTPPSAVLIERGPRAWCGGFIRFCFAWRNVFLSTQEVGSQCPVFV